MIEEAVLAGFTEGGSMQEESPIHQAAREVFEDSYDYYTETCRRNRDKDGEPMVDLLGEYKGKFQFQSLLGRLEDIKQVLSKEGKN